MKNKRGWIRIVEAFVAVLLITGVLLVVMNKGYIGRTDISEKVYDAELSILREIELDDGLREKVMDIDLVLLPLEEGDAEFPPEITLKVMERTPDYLDCSVKICKINDVCGLNEYLEEDVYAQKVIITATLEKYNPRQLKLFCWTG